MTVREWRLGDVRVTRRCADASAPAVYIHGFSEVPEAFGWTVISIDGIDWNRDLTPWPAKAVFRGQPDFGGGAGAYLRTLTEEIMPTAEEGLNPGERIIAGYSLAGLFAVYAALETERFDACASVSGSMWYPAFAEYAARKKKDVKAAYFSVGDREKLGRNRAFHAIEECTACIAEALSGCGAETVFELNPGGHFDNPEGRMLRALQWLRERLERRNGG